jgi:hypothetical protein
MPKVFEFKLEHDGKLHCHQYHILCPGCGDVHAIGVGIHGFNGNFEKPTFTPSLLCFGSRFVNKDPNDGTTEPFRCHSYVTDGNIQFLDDCTHALKGQTVELPEYTGTQS